MADERNEIMEIIEQERASLEAIEIAIQSKYGEALDLAGRAKRNQRGAVLAMAGVGELLLTAGEIVRKTGEPKGEWLARVGVLPDHADKAIFLARNRDQLELDLWPKDIAKVGLKVCDLLPHSPLVEPSKPEKTESKTAQHWLSHTIKLRSSLEALTKDQPIESWREDERENVKLSLLPIVKFYNSL